MYVYFSNSTKSTNRKLQNFFSSYSLPRPSSYLKKEYCASLEQLVPGKEDTIRNSVHLIRETNCRIPRRGTIEQRLLLIFYKANITTADGMT